MALLIYSFTLRESDNDKRFSIYVSKLLLDLVHSGILVNHARLMPSDVLCAGQ